MADPDALLSVSFSSILQMIREAKAGRLQEYTMHLPLPRTKFLSLTSAVILRSPPLAFCDGYVRNNLVLAAHYGNFYLIIEQEENRIRASVTRDVSVLAGIRFHECYENLLVPRKSSPRCLFL